MNFKVNLPNIELGLSSPVKPSDKANYDEPSRANVLNSIFNVIFTRYIMI